MEMPTGPRSGKSSNRPQPWRQSARHRSAKPRTDDSASAPSAVPPGYAVRALAVRIVSSVFDRKRALDDALTSAFAHPSAEGLELRDRALARLIATTVLRRRGELDVIVGHFIERPLPPDRGLLSHILNCAAAQLILLEMPPHAVINIAVEQCRHDTGARRFDKLANAVLRRVAEQGIAVRADNPQGARLNAPPWMWQRWQSAYGEETAQRIIEGALREAPLDLTPKTPADAAGLAETLGGKLLPSGSIRLLRPDARVEALPGYAEGSWWVQDAAAALPARFLGNVTGKRVADLCAAPGGKTAQLAAAGAAVTAVDVSKNRLERVRENLDRLRLDATIVAADIETWQPGETFDAILLDAPCTSTGTIRRHPDILALKRETDMAALTALQSRLLEKAAALLEPGGLLVYCTCSLEPEEGAEQIERFLARTPHFKRAPLSAESDQLAPEWITAAGDLRTLPFHDPAPDVAAGMDGFFAARLIRTP